MEIDESYGMRFFGILNHSVYTIQLNIFFRFIRSQAEIVTIIVKGINKI